MTPQRWKGAGIVFLGIAALLIVAAVVSVLVVAAPPTVPLNTAEYEPISASLFGVSPGLLRGVILGAFAGVAFFLGLTCFMWSGMAEANRQRAEILTELTALRTRADHAAPPARPAEPGA
ncbi:MAG TPA: hypothetical protein VHX38_01830 [Pseudonocardiaceae bacterium]|jgi:hypothetical protein|nr:hypothetical protein [Pseudonocardiaceae bacterium]